ncbi:MAG: hypothetical protein CM15mV49_820 [uncultured marine virus]|nr:MAG: hypothetical protein CM15mV49_820 [uncultured marine virus]
MRVVVGTGGGTGGSDTFQTTFASSRSTETKDLPVAGSVSLSGTVGGKTLSTPEIPSHNHPFTVFNQTNENIQGKGATGGNYSGTVSPVQLNWEIQAVAVVTLTHLVVQDLYQVHQHQVLHFLCQIWI